MTNKNTLQTLINQFANGDLRTAALEFFKVLGYSSNKTGYSDLTKFLSKLNHEKALVNQWQSSHLLFQLTDDDLQGNLDVFSSSNQAIDNTIIQSYLFSAIELNMNTNLGLYSRTELVQITRAINKASQQPVLLLFKHGNSLTFSVIHRRVNKIDNDKDVLEKVTLLKDIRIENTHRAHLNILTDFSFKNLESQPKNFVDLHHAWRKVLDTKTLNKQFYKELSQWYFWAMKEVYFPDAKQIEAIKGGVFEDENKVREHNAKNLIRLLTRLLFVWFIKEKHLIPEQLFNEDWIKSQLNEFNPKINTTPNFKSLSNNSGYYRAILQNLFFATLNQTQGKRAFRNDGQNMNVTTLMRYQSYFNDSAAFLSLVESIVPFMNGGLFDCLDKPIPNVKGKQGGDIIAYEDGFSDRPDNQLKVPDYIFFGTHKNVDLSAELGNKYKSVEIKGLCDILKSYKFTLTENTPIEEDIALDPELLGQVFENLLASYNPETKTTARKQTGSFYTPREIVDYMVDESLLAYFSGVQASLALASGACTPEDKLRDLLSYNDLKNPFNDTETIHLINAIDNCKILDPACGSGAFPMGILHKLVHCLHKLDPQNLLWKARQIEKINAIDDPDFRDKTLQALEDAFDNEVDYGRKLYLIENCIYGVDIQAIAIQISKLRFFISLIVDQTVRDTKENFGVLPLPNLETKFVAANTLIGIEKPKVGINADSTRSLFDSQEIETLENQLKTVRHRLFSAKTPATKRKLRDEDKVLREQIGELLEQHGWGNATAQQLAHWNPYDQNASADFFDVEWMFGLSDGFDIVIGNPPYVFARNSLEKGITEQDKKYFYSNFELAKYQVNLYPLFIEKGFNLIKDYGILCYITPNNWLTINTNKDLRKFVLQQSNIKIVNFYAKVFESAAVDSCIITFSKSGENKSVGLFEYTDSLTLINSSPADYFLSKKDYVINVETFKNNQSLGLIDKIEALSVELGELADVKVGLGAYGVNKGIPAQTPEMIKQRIYHSKTKLTDEYIKYLEGSDVCRYSLLWSGEYLKYGKHLREPRNDFSLFSTQRILVRQIPSKPPYCINACLTDELALNDRNSMNLVRFKESPEFILAVLNSRLISYWFIHKFGKMQRGVFPQFKVNELASFPIPKIPEPEQQPFIKLVDEILAAKKSGNDTSALEREIDVLVYGLYGLSDDEIKIIEGVK